jgi:hypothetical protein
MTARDAAFGWACLIVGQISMVGVLVAATLKDDLAAFVLMFACWLSIIVGWNGLPE